MQLRSRTIGTTNTSEQHNYSDAENENENETEIYIDNVQHGEVIFQRCLLIRGQSRAFTQFGDHIKVTVANSLGEKRPEQTWPMSMGHFKALVMLLPGHNIIEVQRYHGGVPKGRCTFTLTYVPHKVSPPLHLAIMIAKDSPLVMDCPSWKSGGISTAHSGVEAAVAKLRTAAYMWQAMTAEDMYCKRLERQSFRLDEEWAENTTTQANVYRHLRQKRDMASIAKVHLVRSNKTVAEIQDPRLASTPSKLYDYFKDALKQHGGVFSSSARPFVAGMILDSHYSIDDQLVVGHSALGRRDPNGVSLAVFGSHLTYSWPRFFEEIASCLTDTTPPGDTVYTANGELGTCWESCSASQAGMLRQVGNCFGASYVSGILADGHAQHWPRNFVAETAYSEATMSKGLTVIPGQTPNNALWNIHDNIYFSGLPHFQHPQDNKQRPRVDTSTPIIIDAPSKDARGGSNMIRITCAAGIASVQVAGGKNPVKGFQVGMNKFDMDFGDIAGKKDGVSLRVLACNSRSTYIYNVLELFDDGAFVNIVNSDMVLRKVSTLAERYSSGCHGDRFANWTVLLSEKNKEGRLTHATSIDLRVGDILDGAIVHYDDEHKTNCGPQYAADGKIWQLGGGRSQKLTLPSGIDIDRVAVYQTPRSQGVLGGIRMTLADGTAAGWLNVAGILRNDESAAGVITLKPRAEERIVGFFGASDKLAYGYCTEFGIICAPKHRSLPPQVYDMPELQNKTRR